MSDPKPAEKQERVGNVVNGKTLCGCIEDERPCAKACGLDMSGSMCELETGLRQVYPEAQPAAPPEPHKTWDDAVAYVERSAEFLQGGSLKSFKVLLENMRRTVPRKSEAKPAETQVVPKDLLAWRHYLSAGEDGMSLEEQEALLDRCVGAEQRIARLEEAAGKLKDLFEEPSPFYIKKLGGPITNGDQAKIDAAFIALDAALAATEGETR